MRAYLLHAEPLPREAFRIDKVVKPFTILKTKRIVVGLGARKDSSAESIIEAVETALEQTHISLSKFRQLRHS